MKLCDAALFGRADGELKDAAVFARDAECFAFGGKRLDEDSFPPVSLEQPRLAEFDGRVRADFDEEAVGLAIEKFPDQNVLAEL